METCILGAPGAEEKNPLQVMQGVPLGTGNPWQQWLGERTGLGGPHCNVLGPLQAESGACLWSWASAPQDGICVLTAEHLGPAVGSKGSRLPCPNKLWPLSL